MVMLLKDVKCRKINDTRIYPGSPHKPRVLQSPYAVRDFNIIGILYKPNQTPRTILLDQEQSSWTKNNPLGFFTKTTYENNPLKVSNLFPTILDNKNTTSI